MSIDVILPEQENIDIIVDATVVEILQDAPVQVEVALGNGVSQQNLWVGAVQPEFSAPGIWVETGLGDNTEDFTIWIEDGT